MSNHIVDRIYEAAFVPDLWTELVESLAAGSNSAAGSMIMFGPTGPPSFISTSLTRARMEAFFGGDEWKGILRVDVAKRLEWTGFRRDAEYLTPEQIAHDLVEHQLKDAGLARQLCTYIPMPGEGSVFFTFERRLDQGSHDNRSISIAGWML